MEHYQEVMVAVSESVIKKYVQRSFAENLEIIHTTYDLFPLRRRNCESYLALKLAFDSRVLAMVLRVQALASALRILALASSLAFGFWP